MLLRPFQLGGNGMFGKIKFFRDLFNGQVFFTFHLVDLAHLLRHPVNSPLDNFLYFVFADEVIGFASCYINKMFPVIDPFLNDVLVLEDIEYLVEHRFVQIGSQCGVGRHRQTAVPKPGKYFLHDLPGFFPVLEFTISKNIQEFIVSQVDTLKAA